MNNLKKPVIGFLSEFDPFDKKASSGTSFKMAEQLSKIGTLKWIPVNYSKFSKNLFRIESFANKILPKRLMIKNTKLGSKYIYNKINSILLEEMDIIAAFFCSPVIQYLNTEKPIIYFSDATFPIMLDYNPDFKNLWRFNKNYGIELEKRLLKKVNYAVFSSDWARNSAIKDLDGNPEKIKVVEFGPNIDEKDIISKIRSYNSDNASKINILFLGVNWDRKGGDLAVKTCQKLLENNYNLELNIVGIQDLPNDVKSLPFIKNYGFLNKNIKEDYSKLIQIINDSHILLLPTKNECAGIAFAEASAFGIPIVTHDTGGIPNYVINNFNGFRLPLGSSSNDFATKIEKIIKSLPQYSENAISYYYTKLNYSRWGG